MDRTHFQIIFEKFAHAAKDNGDSAEWAILSEAGLEELDEIAELRRLSSELTPPDVTCYTST